MLLQAVSVRSAFVFVSANTLVPQDTLAPYMNELLLQASMGLSHIYHDIRVDACRLISLLLTIAPSHVVGHWPLNAGNAAANQANENRILDGLRLVAGIGGRAGEGGQNGLNLLPKSKLVILDTLLAFVKGGLRKQGMLKGSGREGRVSATAQDLQFPVEIFEPFQPRYPSVDRLSATTRYDSKGKGREVLSVSRLGDAAVAETGQLFDGWLVSQWGDETLIDTIPDGLWNLASIGQRGEEEGGENVGQALSVSRTGSTVCRANLYPGTLPPHAPLADRHPHGVRPRRILALHSEQQPGSTRQRRRPPLPLPNDHGARLGPRWTGLGPATKRSVSARCQKGDICDHRQDVCLLSVRFVCECRRACELLYDHAGA